MKKIIYILLTLTICVMFTACGSKQDKNEIDPNIVGPDCTVKIISGEGYDGSYDWFTNKYFAIEHGYKYEEIIFN